jgi:hypothetical protein
MGVDIVASQSTSGFGLWEMKKRMKGIARLLLVGGVSSAIAAVAIAALWPADALATFGIARWEAGTCVVSSCKDSGPHSEFYTQAAGHPNFGITDFEFNSKTVGVFPLEAKEPEGHVKNVRVDLPPGLSVDPLAVPTCERKAIESNSCPVESMVGEDIITVFLAALNVTVSEPVYNMQTPPGVPAEFGVDVTLTKEQIYLVGGISWHDEPVLEARHIPSGDYHEYFNIENIPNTLSVLESKLVFKGNIGKGGFITMPSTCNGPQVTHLWVESYVPGETAEADNPTPVGASGCSEVPFKPEVAVKPATTQSDRPDGATVEVKVPQNEGANAINSSTVQDARVTLPAGMTLDPSAANGLQACTDTQFARGQQTTVSCPAGSQIGTVTIETPNLPAGSLMGNVYVGQPLSSSPESGTEYRIFIDAESPRYGVSVRLVGMVSANASTGQLTTAVLQAPQIPFSDFIVTLGGPHVPLANPLVCGTASSVSALTPYTGNPPAMPLLSFPVDFDGKGAACPSSLPFALSQSTQDQPTTGGSTAGFTLGLVRGVGNQYLEKVSATLPPGLVAKVPSVTPCDELQAGQDKCPPASQIGTVSVALGSGPTPLMLSGTVYFTGPYAGAPYGLLVAVPAEKIGPFDYGTIVTRATISIDPYSARVTAASTLPTIVGGVPLRLRSLTVNVNRPNFTLNPTNCGTLATETLLTSTFGATQLASTPFQASDCKALSFKPKFSASTSAKTSRANGASLEVSVGYPKGAQANIRSVVVELPKRLSSRLSTLNKACPEATFKVSSNGCPAASDVGSVTVITPVLPKRLTGHAFFVSHGGAAFPDLDLVLNGNGVTIILVGNTYITSKGITISTFASLPDVPVASFHLKLPTGPHSALGAHGSLCSTPLAMPTTITAQNGAVVKQKTHIAVKGCRRHHRKHRHRRHHGRSRPAGHSHRHS